jgi:hypothetical protein
MVILKNQSALSFGYIADSVTSILRTGKDDITNFGGP